jgi:hypothetical protein
VEHPYRESSQVEEKLVRLELADRLISVVGRAVLVILTIGLAVTTIVCALHGVPWPIPLSTGGSGAITGLLSARPPGTND